MNKTRRKQIANIRQRLAALLATADDIKTDLETIRDEEQDYRDNMPESLADSDKAQASEAAIEAMDGVIQDLESLIDNPFDDPLTDAAA